MGPNLTPAEGMILGTAAKMFTIAGPVIVYGVSCYKKPPHRGGFLLALLPVKIHPGHIRFPVALDHTQKFPTVPLVKAHVVGDQIGGRNALAPQILHRHVQKLSGDALLPVTFLGVNGADIGG